MMELAKLAEAHGVPTDEAVHMNAEHLSRADLGKLIVVATGAALYVGRLWKIAHYPSRVYITVMNGKAEADESLEPGVAVIVSTRPAEAYGA